MSTWWAWDGEKLHLIGDFKTFEDADDACKFNYNWLFSREWLTAFVEDAQQQLNKVQIA